MKMYRLKAALRGISPMVWRRLKIDESTSLAQLHHILQAVFQWDNDYLHQFHIYGKDYGIGYVGGLSFVDNAYKVYFRDFEFDIGDKFTYEYNFFAHWLVDIRVENITQTTSDFQPRCIKGNGMHGVNKHDIADAKLNLLHAVAKIDSTTTVADLLPEIEAYQAVMFNRHLINQAIQSGLEEMNE